jgi:hypothetical protein
MAERLEIVCKFQVKCEKLIFEKEDVVAGLIDLIALHGVTELVISAASDMQYSRYTNKTDWCSYISVLYPADLKFKTHHISNLCHFLVSEIWTNLSPGQQSRLCRELILHAKFGLFARDN